MKYVFILGRNPVLSKAEIFSYLEKEKIKLNSDLLKQNSLYVDIEGEINPKEVIDKLGGTIAIGKVLFSGKIEKLKESIENNPIYFDEPIKLVYSIFCYSSDENSKIIIDSMKTNFKNEGLKAKFHKFLEYTIKPTEKIYFFIQNIENHFGIIEAIHNPKQVEERDMEKPVRREELAISPRISKILINLSQAKQGQELVDPFCGIGVILQEALIQDINVTGIDNDSSATKHAKLNIEWIKTKYNFNANFNILTDDSKKVVLQKIDAIATEPELGDILTKVPDENITKSNLRKFEDLMIDVLNNLKKYTKPNTKIAFTSPLIKTNKGRKSCDIEKILNQTQLKIYNLKNSNIKFPITELREHKIIGRDIYVLIT
ncbi:MAG: hypothetical protein KKF56_03005 [Nanoarchaeota archaeon]|nr:hypothetical protein [Nanoarchaeota archaeon]